ncbi:hypothetical protein L6164_023664 [Bauhinia variegata]|uniref:Uncharacterized protein n=1 Tax=Bauhinia variegata TaxID=167791 RepID=A0ACB9MJ21_BAUVA|nr:hypothetical protein L6164_023664 [Bauhinia variegata]
MENSTSFGCSSEVSSSMYDCVLCKCRVIFEVQVSWTNKNPRRRFFGCGEYDGSSSHCDFFAWFDPPTN